MDRDRRAKREAADEGGAGAPAPGKVQRSELRGRRAATAGLPFMDVMIAGGAVQRKGAADGGTAMAGGWTHEVKKGETLWEIAKAAYGEGKYWTRIRDANPGKVQGGHLVAIGAVLVLPEVEMPMLDAMARERAAGQYDDVKKLGVSMDDAAYGAFLAGLKEAEREAHGHTLQLVELMRSTGKTPAELAEDQRAWLEAAASARKMTVAELVRERLDGEGHGTSETREWDALDEPVKAEWKARFDALVPRVRAAAPPELQEFIAQSDKLAARKGGAFAWSPARTLALNAFAFMADKQLHCGTEFVAKGEQDLSLLWGSIAHELGGHIEYGGRFGLWIMHDVTLGMTDEDRKLATGGNSIGSGYGYMETEIFAELYEVPYDSAENPTDRAFEKKTRKAPDGSTRTAEPDVAEQLAQIRDAFEPGVAVGLVRSLALRVELDTFIQPHVKARFRRDVQDVFGDILPPWSAPQASSQP